MATTTPTLNVGQQRIYDAVVRDRLSVFYGGEAGTGKTHVADVMIHSLTAAGVRVCVCASTGQAAQHLENGFTVHMLFGLRPSKTGAGPAQRNSTWPMQAQLGEAEVIFVDEVSMLDEQLMEDMNTRLSLMRGSAQPFGGVQIVALGDFLQLPPVQGKFCFHSALFAATFGDRCYRLTQQMRQGEDLEFARILSQIRLGECTYGVESMLRQRLFTADRAPSAKDVTYLFCRREQVETKNAVCLAALPFQETVWVANDWTLRPEFSKTLQGSTLDEKLTLKTGAPVLLRKNFDAKRRLVNGTRGVVVGTAYASVGAKTCTEGTMTYELLGEAPSGGGIVPVVEFNGASYAVGTTKVEKFRGNQREGRKRKADDSGDAPPENGKKGELVASRIQIPLTLAFALTVHKAQGMTLPKVCFAWNNAFDNGQIYVALSRVRRLDDIYIISDYVPKRRITAAADALAFERTRVLPV